MVPVLLLHGFTGAPSSFDGVVAAMPDGVHAITPLLTGHGDPPAAPEIDHFEAEADRLAAFISGPEPAIVAGYSLGARLALAIALRHPGRVRGLVLASGNAGLRTFDERTARRRRDAELARRLETGGLEAFVLAWEREPLFATQTRLSEELRAAERARRMGHTREGLAASLRSTGLAEMPDYWEDLRTLRIPVEVLCGELDVRFCTLGRAMAAELSNVLFRPVRGAGHNLLLEAPDVVAAAIARSLA